MNPVAKDGVVGVAAHVEDFHFWKPWAEGIGEFAASEVGHDHVGEEQVDDSLVGFHDAKSVDAVVSEDEGIALVFQGEVGDFE